MKKTIEGSFSLDDLKNTIVNQEQLGFIKLTDLQKEADDPPTNVASFADDSSPAGPAPLNLIEIGPNDTTTIANQTAQGRTLIFNSIIYVSSIERRGAGFR